MYIENEGFKEMYIEKESRMVELEIEKVGLKRCILRRKDLKRCILRRRKGWLSWRLRRKD